MYKFYGIAPSNDKKHKYTALFKDLETDKFKTVDFGAYGYSDYTLHKNPKEKNNYINRHKVRENWNNPIAKGTLSRYILWNLPDLDDSIKDYENRFFK
jgi:hypothetical protein